MHYRHGQWVDNDGNPIELTEPEVGHYEGAAPEPAEEAKPKRSRSAKKDPRESKGDQ